MFTQALLFTIRDFYMLKNGVNHDHLDSSPDWVLMIDILAN